MNGIIIKNKKQICIYFFVMLISFFHFFVEIKKSEYKMLFILLSMAILFIEALIFLFIILKEKKIKIQNVFLILSIFLGITYMFAMPLEVIPDENGHFFRAYNISDGHLITDKNSENQGAAYIPKSAVHIFDITNLQSTYNYIDDFKEELDYEKNNENNTTFTNVGGQALYSPICYIPQVIGILVGKILKLPMLFICYLTRLFNLATWIAIIYFTLKFLPSNKLAILMLIMLPVNIQQAASCSADALTNCISFAIVAYVLYYIETKKKISKISYVIASCLAILMSMCKIVYLPICLIYYLIPKECFNNNKDKLLKVTVLGIFVTVINLIWLKISSTYLFQVNEGVDGEQQALFILSNPFRFLYLVWISIYTYGAGYLYNFNSIGSYNIPLSGFYYALYYFIIFFVIIFDSFNQNITKYTKFLIAFIIIVSVLLTFASLYVQWCSVGAPIIDGVQGRYFIPLLPLLVLLFARNKKYKELKIDSLLVYSSILSFNMYVLANIFGYYI